MSTSTSLNPSDKPYIPPNLDTSISRLSNALSNNITKPGAEKLLNEAKAAFKNVQQEYQTFIQENSKGKNSINTLACKLMEGQMTIDEAIQYAQQLTKKRSSLDQFDLDRFV